MTKKTYSGLATSIIRFAKYSVLTTPIFAHAAEIKLTDEASYWAWGALLFGFVILLIVIKLYRARSSQDQAMRNIFSDKY